MRTQRFLFVTAADARLCGTTRAGGHLIADPSGTIDMVGDLVEDFVAYAQAAATDHEDAT